jgi:hypothetical protein
LYTTVLQRTSVTMATAMALIGETLVPAALGLALLGDQPRPGAQSWALGGFVLTVGGGLVLARYGQIEAPRTSPRSVTPERAGKSSSGLRP